MMTRTLIPGPSDPGASADAVILDTGAISFQATTRYERRGNTRVRTGFYTNVADAVFNVSWYAPGSSNARSVAAVAIPANTYFQRDVLLQPGRTRVFITTITDPTTWEIGVELIEDQALSQ